MSFNIAEWSVLGAITLVDDLPLFGVSPWWRPLVASQTSLEEGEGGSVPPLPPLSLFIIIIFFFSVLMCFHFAHFKSRSGSNPAPIDDLD